MPELTVGGHRLEYQWIPGRRRRAPTLVFLHECLGCIELWRDLPERITAKTGCGAVVYSRYGSGRSDPLQEPRTDTYLHTEALETLPDVLEQLDVTDPLLIGHSDGATIALMYAGSGRWPVRGLVAMAPHVFVEDVTIAGIEHRKADFVASAMTARLGRYHTDPVSTFNGWCDTWLKPSFRNWNIEAYVAGITCPVLLIQGHDDEYATMAQLDAIERAVSGPTTRLELTDCGHVPFRDHPESVIGAICDFINKLT